MEHDYLRWEKDIDNILTQTMIFDSAHDLGHIHRVTQTALELSSHLQANPFIIYPACMLHDCVNVDKNSLLRNQSSRLSADKAIHLLRKINYPNELLESIHHAIAAHSFSAQIEAETIEAKVVQDADRLDSLGAVGLSRCLMLAGNWGSAIYHYDDPLAATRPYDDKNFCLDHFFTKLKKIPQMMKTEPGRKEAEKRWIFMKQYIDQLCQEINIKMMW